MSKSNWYKVDYEIYVEGFEKDNSQYVLATNKLEASKQALLGECHNDDIEFIECEDGDYRISVEDGMDFIYQVTSVIEVDEVIVHHNGVAHKVFLPKE